jgi:hypothetical protein
MRCKNCGKDIIQVSGRWYHKESQKWYCDTSHAVPESNPSGNIAKKGVDVKGSEGKA